MEVLFVKPYRHILEHSLARVLSATVLLAAMAGLAGCAPLARPNLQAPPESYSPKQSAADTTPEETDGYSCPGRKNIVPEYDYAFDGSGFYEVCTKQDSLYDLRIHGRTAYSRRICLFPARWVSDSDIRTQLDPVTGRMIHKCYDIQGDGLDVSFPNTNFNFLFIVEGPDEEGMLSCLGGRPPLPLNYGACPPFSYGKFRN